MKHELLSRGDKVLVKDKGMEMWQHMNYIGYGTELYPIVVSDSEGYVHSYQECKLPTQKIDYDDLRELFERVKFDFHDDKDKPSRDEVITDMIELLNVLQNRDNKSEDVSDLIVGQLLLSVIILGEYEIAPAENALKKMVKIYEQWKK